jgi:cell fate (sporulation/competence/biofilm development) regulator YmcA (YheA/YmcA/DUF963 family)
MENQQHTIEEKIDQELEHLIDLLTQKDEIVAFKTAEENISDNKWIQEKIELIKEKQKNLVNFEYYEKPQAYKKTLNEVEVLNNEINMNISVQKYRTSLAEANEIVQHLFKRIQNEIDLINN